MAPDAGPFAQLVALSRDGIVVINRARRIRLANPAFAHLLGIPSGDGLIGSELAAHIYQADQRHFEGLGGIADAPAMGDRLPLQLVRQDGRLIPTEISVAPIRWDSQDGYLLIVRDESARQQLEGEVRQLQKVEAIGAFATEIAHDFANVLLVIGGSARALEKRDDDREARAAALQDLREAVARGTEMTRHLLAFVRKAPRSPGLIDPYSEIRAIGAMLRRLLPDGMTLKLDLETFSPLLRLDRTDLEQVLLNLVVNARNAMGNSGTITIRTLVDQEARLLIEVIDDGPGVPNDQPRPTISSNSDVVSTGLGLGIVRRIVQGAKGIFTMDSTADGTTCRVSLPTVPLSGRPTSVVTPRYVTRIEPTDGELVR